MPGHRYRTSLPSLRLFFGSAIVKACAILPLFCLSSSGVVYAPQQKEADETCLLQVKRTLNLGSERLQTREEAFEHAEKLAAFPTGTVIFPPEKPAAEKPVPAFEAEVAKNLAISKEKRALELRATAEKAAPYNFKLNNSADAITKNTGVQKAVERRHNVEHRAKAREDKKDLAVQLAAAFEDVKKAAADEAKAAKAMESIHPVMPGEAVAAKKKSGNHAAEDVGIESFPIRSLADAEKDKTKAQQTAIDEKVAVDNFAHNRTAAEEKAMQAQKSNPFQFPVNDPAYAGDGSTISMHSVPGNRATADGAAVDMDVAKKAGTADKAAAIKAEAAAMRAEWEAAMKHAAATGTSSGGEDVEQEGTTRTLLGKSAERTVAALGHAEDEGWSWFW